jgi:hypothetical protein
VSARENEEEARRAEDVDEEGQRARDLIGGGWSLAKLHSQRPAALVSLWSTIASIRPARVIERDAAFGGYGTMRAVSCDRSFRGACVGGGHFPVDALSTESRA